MSKKLYSLFLPVALVLVSLAGLLRLYSHRTAQETRSVDRTIVLEAEDGKFMKDGIVNPELTVQSGELVRLVFKNTDIGVKHAITVPSQTDRVYQVPGGEQVSLLLQFQEPGRYRYTCPQHEPFMEGVIRVKESNR